MTFLFVFDHHDPWEKSVQTLTDLVRSRGSSLRLLDTGLQTSLALLASRLCMMGLSTFGSWQPQFDRSQLASHARSQGATCVVLLEQEFPRNLSQRQQRLLLEKTGLEVIILPRETPLAPRENLPVLPREIKPSQLAREPLLRQKVLV